jgi:drug/metabolite transporter (DMT)-like permease
MRDAGLPITLIVVGLVWLAWQFRIFPDIDWVIAAGLVAGGVAVLVFDGITKSSVVIGPFLMATGAAWALHEFQRIDWRYLIPALLVVLGTLMLVARRPGIPERKGQKADRP